MKLLMTIKKNILWLVGILFAHFLYSQSNAVCPVQIMNKAGEDKFYLFAYTSKLPIDSIVLSQGSYYCFKIGNDHTYPIFSLKAKKEKQKYNAHAIPLSILFSREGKVLQINPPLDVLIR